MAARNSQILGSSWFHVADAIDASVARTMNLIMEGETRIEAQWFEISSCNPLRPTENLDSQNFTQFRPKNCRSPMKVKWVKGIWKKLQPGKIRTSKELDLPSIRVTTPHPMGNTSFQFGSLDIRVSSAPVVSASRQVFSYILKAISEGHQDSESSPARGFFQAPQRYTGTPKRQALQQLVMKWSLSLAWWHLSRGPARRCAFRPCL